jgi:hypothetical protein
MQTVVISYEQFTQAAAGATVESARQYQIDPEDAYRRFCQGDWGAVNDECRTANDDALASGDGLVTAFYASPMSPGIGMEVLFDVEVGGLEVCVCEYEGG